MKVADPRGFSAAQTLLNISTPTVSNHKSALQRRLGVKLCKRGRAGFRLTPEGEVVYRETQKLFAAVGDYDSKIASLRSSPP